jgi:arsenate reductase
MLTFICYPKCTTCQKAKALLDSYHAQYEVRDIKTDNPKYEELKGWLTLSELPINKFFNTSGALYKSLGLKDKLPFMSEDECLKLLATDGMLVKRPMLVSEYSVLVGFKLPEWESVFEYDRKKTDIIFSNYFNEMLELIKLQEIADKSPFKIRIVNTQSGKVTIKNNDIALFDDAEFVLSYANLIERYHGCRNNAVYKVMFEEQFFDVSSGFAGELAQELNNNGFKLAIIGDFSGYKSKLHDFINESNKNGPLFFVADESEALEKLGG